MKKIILVVLIGLGAWNFYDKQSAANFGEVTAFPKNIGVSETLASTSVAQSFNCDGRVYCSEMTSKAEAEYFTRNCPGTKMDGDHDGAPCENDSRF